MKLLSHIRARQTASSGGRKRGATARGFTLIELMVVVVIITLLAALAGPSIISRMRDRRVREAAQRVALLFQEARLRAMARGSAITVSFSALGTGRLETLEARQPSALLATGLPQPSCLAADWQAGSGENTQLSVFDLTDRGEYGGNVFTRAMNGATVLSTLQICFTPMGRAFAREDLGQQFTPLTTIYSAQVAREVGGDVFGIARNVVVLPSGVARIQ